MDLSTIGGYVVMLVFVVLAAILLKNATKAESEEMKKGKIAYEVKRKERKGFLETLKQERAEGTSIESATIDHMSEQMLSGSEVGDASALKDILAQHREDVEKASKGSIVDRVLVKMTGWFSQPEIVEADHDFSLEDLLANSVAEPATGVDSEEVSEELERITSRERYDLWIAGILIKRRNRRSFRLKKATVKKLVATGDGEAVLVYAKLNVLPEAAIDIVRSGMPSLFELNEAVFVYKETDENLLQELLKTE